MSPQPGEQPSYRHARKVLAGSMFLMGACGLSYQYTLGALGNNLMGSTNEQIFVIIGLMMFAMGLSSMLQVSMVGALLDRFVVLQVTLGLIGGYSALATYAAFVYTQSHQLVLYLTCLVIGGLIGLEIPMLIRINKTYASSLRTNLGEILSMDYVGSLAGALLFTYVLLTRLPLPQISFGLGLANVTIGLCCLAYFWRLTRRPTAITFFGVSAWLALLVGFVMTPQTLASLQQRTFEDPVIFNETTRYQHIVMTRFREQLRLYINGNLQFDSKDEHIYHELLVHPPMLAAGSTSRVLVLGGGDGLAVRELLRYTDINAIVVVDIDPAITRLAAEHPDLVALNEGALRDARVRPAAAHVEPSGQRANVVRRSKEPHKLKDKDVYSIASVEVLNLDADRFLQSVEGSFDVAILDFPDPSVLELAKLYSVDFYANLRRRLSPGGVIAVQSTSPWHAREVFLCIGESIRAAGFQAVPYHQNVPSFGEWGWHLAWVDDRPPHELLTRITSHDVLPVPTRYATPEVLASAFVFGKGWLNATGIRPNTKLQPVLVEYYRKAWSNM